MSVVQSSSDTVLRPASSGVPEPSALTSVAAFHELFKAPVIEGGPKMPPKDRCKLRVSLLQEELDELKAAIDQDDLVEAADALADIQYVLSGAVLEFGLHRRFQTIFDEVQRSNMSKACRSLEEAERTRAHYKATMGVESEVKPSGDLFLVYRLPDNKVLKSVEYSAAQLRPLVEAPEEQFLPSTPPPKRQADGAAAAAWSEQKKPRPDLLPFMAEEKPPHGAGSTPLGLSLIVAATPKGGIGNDGGLVWNLPEDMARFRELTSRSLGPGQKNVVIMGSKTWDSIPAKFRPLKGRINVVLSSTRSAADFGEQVMVARSVKEALAMFERGRGANVAVGEVFVIGGQRAYAEAMGLPTCKRIYLTRVGKEFECDAFFPKVDEERFQAVEVSATKSHDNVPFDFVTYERVETKEPDGPQQQPTKGYPTPTAPGQKQEPELEPGLDVLERPIGGGALMHEEFQYLEMIREIMKEGYTSGDRTGVGIISKFGKTMRFDLSKSFPLLTTKRVFWRGVAEELLWFVRGDTNAKHLQEKDIHIWDGNSTKEFLEKRGLGHREEGDLGPVYGFQWRHFGATYTDMHADYKGQGVDQLAECIQKLKTDPTDRRMLLSAWNPADLAKMALPPCHMFCQFYVANQKLSCLMYQRSCDMGLGVPFNIASYALLTRMVAQVCGLEPGELIHAMGNTHVYLNHVEPLKTQLTRVPRPFPTLRINPEVKEIDQFQMSDFELVGYNPHPKIAMEMAV